MRRTRTSQRGAALVELAIIVPVLVLLVYMVSEGAALIRTHQLVNNAAREGARFSSIDANECRGEAACLDQIRQVVVDYGTRNGLTINPANITIDQTTGVLSGGVLMKTSVVTVVHPYTLQMLPAFGVPSVFNLAARVQFRNLY